MVAGTSLIFDILAKDRASGVFKSLSHEVDGFDKKLRGLNQLGDIGGKVALGATAGLAAIIGVTANFEKAMSNVKAATGEGEAGMKALRDAALQAGADTAFSASEAAGAIENLAKAGVSTQDILGGGLAGALDLAAAGEIDVATAAEQAATAMTQFGLAGEDVPHIADLLAASAGKAQGEVTDMGMALNQAGLVADQVGLSIEETTGALGAFASAGLLGSDAGTSFKTMLGALTPNSAKAAETMEELGISAYDSQGNFIGLANFAGNLKDALSGLTDQQRQSALETIFGSDAVRAASIIYEQGADGVQTWIDKVNDSGFAAEQAETKLDNLAGDFEALKGSLETALIGSGEGSQGALRGIVQNLTDVVNAYNDLPPAAQNATTGILGVTAVLGGGIWVTSKVVTGIADTRQALSDLGVQAGRTKSALVGLVAAGTALAVAIPVVRQLNDALLDIKIGSGNVSRELESIGKGVPTKALDDFTGQLGSVTSGYAKWDESSHELMTGFGLFGDTVRDKATKNIQEVDEALASLVESGNADQAAAAYAEMSAAAADAGISQRDLNNQFEQYDQALRNADLKAPGAFLRELATAAGIAVEPTEDAAGAIDGAGNAAGRARRPIAEMSAAMRESRKSARETAGEFVGLGDKLDNAKVSLKGWLRDLEKQADALRDFRQNAEKAAKKGLDEGLIASLEKAGPAGALRMRQLANATDAEIKRANKAWQSGQQEINRYVDAVGGVPRRVGTDLVVNPGNSIPIIHGVISALSKVRDKVVHITTVFERHNIDINDRQGRTGREITTDSDFDLHSPAAERSLLAELAKMAGGNRFQGIGAGIVKSLLRGLNSGSANQAEIAVERMMKAIKKALDDKKITKAAAERMRATVREMEREAERGRAAIQKRLDFANQLKESFKSELDLGSIVESEDFAGIGSITGGAQGLATRLMAFANQLQELKREGIPKGLIAEIASLGSVRGSEAAAAILAGSDADQNALAAAFNAYQNAAGAASNAAANAVHGTVRQIKNEYHVTLNVHTKGGTDPKDFGREVEKALLAVQRAEQRRLQFQASA